MKKLLIIGYVWPEPKSSAAGSRMLELIELFVANAYQIIFASAATLSEHRADLLSLGVQEKSIELNSSSFNDFLGEFEPSVVLFDRFFTEEQFGWRVEQVCPHALRLLDTEDLHSLRYARQQLFKKAQKKMANEAERLSVAPVLATHLELYAQMAGDDMTQREIAAIYRCDLTLMISQVEIDLLIKYFSVPEQLLHYCPFLNIQIAEQISLPLFSQRQHFISIGNFRHEPNWDAVLYLKYAIWPLIRAQLPQVELHIYGSYPPPKATQLHNPKQGFLVKGWVEDALLAMQHARVCLAPLRFGAGIKGKLMDAMRTATPSVTTDIGAEAMSGGFPWGGAVENSAVDIAAAAVKIYSDENIWQKMQRQGIHVLTYHFAQKSYASSLLQRIDSLKDNLVHERQKNFTGAMLRHHFHKSTQYMSQWIEAKNK
ncbi:MAG: glycosyltransferase [Pseudomonadota bacterium]